MLPLSFKLLMAVVAFPLFQLYWLRRHDTVFQTWHFSRNSWSRLPRYGWIRRFSCLEESDHWHLRLLFKQGIFSGKLSTPLKVMQQTAIKGDTCPWRTSFFTCCQPARMYTSAAFTMMFSFRFHPSLSKLQIPDQTPPAGRHTTDMGRGSTPDLYLSLTAAVSWRIALLTPSQKHINSHTVTSKSGLYHVHN